MTYGLGAPAGEEGRNSLQMRPDANNSIRLQLESLEHRSILIWWITNGQGSTRSDASALRALIDLTRSGKKVGLRAQGKGLQTINPRFDGTKGHTVLYRICI
jgi:hypothetical protein